MDDEERCPTIKKLEVKPVEFKLGEDCWEIRVRRYIDPTKLVMNNLNWQNRNLIDKGVAILQEYSIALEDEEKLMFQRAKNKIMEQDACAMIGEVSNDEIKDAMYSIDDNKAPGPDGIKNVLDSIVDKNQSAFIPERQITDNILLTQEFPKGYDYSKGPKRFSMKIDIQKAYDIVD
ncbi:hypothetical protein Tco_1485650 [Tanacetum coccineum]